MTEKQAVNFAEKQALYSKVFKTITEEFADADVSGSSLKVDQLSSPYGFFHYKKKGGILASFRETEDYRNATRFEFEMWKSLDGNETDTYSSEKFRIVESVYDKIVKDFVRKEVLTVTVKSNGWPAPYAAFEYLIIGFVWSHLLTSDVLESSSKGWN